MPIMGSADAPQFNGERVNEFIRAIEQCGENAGISNLDDLVPYIQWYSRGVRNISNLPGVV